MADTHRQLQVLPPLTGGQERGLFPASVVIDDTPLWIAWEMAKDAWLDAKLRHSGSQHTRRAYEADLRLFYSWAQVSPWDVSPALAQEYARHLSTHLADTSVARKLAACSSFYDFVRRRYTYRRAGEDISLWPADRANPFDAVERGRISPYGRAHYPTTDELRAILAAIHTDTLTGLRDFALLYTFSTTCLRCAAVLCLRWGDIEARNDGHYNIKYRYKGGSLRKAVLHHTAYAAIAAYLRADGRPPETMPPDAHVFVPLHPERAARLPGRGGADLDPGRHTSPSVANRILKKYARRAGVDPAKAHLHALRHAGARLRVEQMKTSGRGVDYIELMNLLGHSSLAVTQIYSQIVLEDPEDPGADAAAAALLPTQRRPVKHPAPTQDRLL